MDGGHFHGLGVTQVRQEPGEPFGQHRFARPRRAREQQVVGAGGGHLQGPPRVPLPGDVAHVRRRPRRHSGLGLRFAGLGRGLEVQGQVLRIGAEVERQPGQGGVALDPRAGHELRLGGVGLRHDDIG